MGGMEEVWEKRWLTMLEKVKVLVLSRVWFCDPMGCSPPGSSVNGILQARLLEWVAFPFSRGSSQPRDWTCVSYVSCIDSWFFTTEPPTIQVFFSISEVPTPHHLWFIKMCLLTGVDHPQYTPFSKTSTDYTMPSSVIQEKFHSLTSKQPMCVKKKLGETIKWSNYRCNLSWFW